jgi:hypothetical protein
MKRLVAHLSVLAIILAFGYGASQAQTGAPTIAGCPSPIPSGTNNWPPSSCKYNFYPLSDTTHAIASVSKTTPTYQHTYPSYAATTLIVACPAGATVSGGSCTSGGKDVSVVVAKSAVPALALGTTPVTPVTPPPVTPTCPADTFVPLTWTCSVSSDGKTATCTAPVSK